jgi:hypothetical protein
MMGHTLARIIPAIEQLIGNTIERLHAGAGYRGHNAPPDYTTPQSKGVAAPHKSAARCGGSAFEPVIGHLKNEPSRLIRRDGHILLQPVGLLLADIFAALFVELRRPWPVFGKLRRYARANARYRRC